MTRVIAPIAIVASVLAGPVDLSAQAREPEVLTFFKAYDAAFNAKDINSGINNGWTDYRDNHLGPELKSFQDLVWSHSNIVVHMLGDASAYVTADYAIKYRSGERAVDSGGIATHVLVKEQGNWKIRHSHTAARRRAPGGF